MGYSQLLFSNEAYIRSEVKQGVLSALVRGKIRASQNVSQSRNRHKSLPNNARLYNVFPLPKGFQFSKFGFRKLSSP